MTTTTAPRTFTVDGTTYVEDPASPVSIEDPDAPGERVAVHQVDPDGVTGEVEISGLPDLAVASPPTFDIAQPIGFPTPAEWAAMSGMANAFARSGIVPKALRGKPDDVMVVIMRGRALRIDPSLAVAEIHVIDGKPSMSAVLMDTLILRAGHEIWPGECNETTATVHGRRRGSDVTVSVTYNLDHALTAGVILEVVDGKVTKTADGKGVWRKYPGDMLFARATSRVARRLFADALAGVTYVPEELDAYVDEDGDIIDVEEAAATTAAEYHAASSDPAQRPLKETDRDRLRDLVADLEPARQMIVRAEWLARMRAGRLPGLDHTLRGHLAEVEEMIAWGRNLTDAEIDRLVAWLTSTLVITFALLPDAVVEAPADEAEAVEGDRCEICGDTDGPFDHLGDPGDRDAIVECSDRAACRQRLLDAKGATTPQEAPAPPTPTPDPDRGSTGLSGGDAGAPDDQLPLA